MCDVELRPSEYHHLHRRWYESPHSDGCQDLQEPTEGMKMIISYLIMKLCNYVLIHTIEIVSRSLYLLTEQD